MSIYKTLGQNDKVESKTLLHEQIPITSSIISGTYGSTYPSESNIKRFNAKTHIDVYDYPYASSSANFMFSMTAGHSIDAPVTASGPDADQVNIKNNIYRQFAQQYVGYDANQNVVPFNVSGVLNPSNNFDPVKVSNVLFINFSRVLGKDEIKKGSFKISLGTGSYAQPYGSAGTGKVTLSDFHVVATDEQTYKSNSPMGDYGFLQLGTSTTHTANYTSSSFGIVYYQAGLLALFPQNTTFGTQFTSGSKSGSTNTPWGYSAAPKTTDQAFLSASVNDICNAARRRIDLIEFNNTTDLNSTIYFCRANNNEFNYSSNPSFTSGGQIAVKTNPSDPSTTYVTSVGLYSADNQLLAVAKLSEPIKKTSSTEFTLRVRLDY